MLSQVPGNVPTDMKGRYMVGLEDDGEAVLLPTVFGKKKAAIPLVDELYQREEERTVFLVQEIGRTQEGSRVFHRIEDYLPMKAIGKQNGAMFEWCKQQAKVIETLGS